MTDYGANVRHMRQLAGYRSGAAAARAMGVAPSTYNQHENGHREPTLRQFERYTVFFHTARLVRRFQDRGEALPEPDVIAVLVHDQISVERTKGWPPSLYLEAVKAVLASQATTLPGEGDKAAPGAPGGRR